MGDDLSEAEGAAPTDGFAGVSNTVGGSGPLVSLPRPEEAEPRYRRPLRLEARFFGDAGQTVLGLPPPWLKVWSLRCFLELFDGIALLHRCLEVYVAVLLRCPGTWSYGKLQAISLSHAEFTFELAITTARDTQYVTCSLPPQHAWNGTRAPQPGTVTIRQKAPAAEEVGAFSKSGRSCASIENVLLLVRRECARAPISRVVTA